MSRPALSALRALEILDLMAGQPAESFTLSDIVRLTGTNAASCHAILNVLLGRGYLLRDPDRKTYRLAPAVVAIGEAAARHDPLLALARDVAGRFAASTGLETLLTARAGADIIAVARFAGASGRPAGMRVGQRVPLRAPLGGLFFAWAGEEEAATWCAPDGERTPAVVVEAHRAALDLLRDRGFLVSLRSAEHGAFSRHLAERDSEGLDGRLTMLLNALDNGLYQPSQIDPDGSYAVQVLSVPIFDRFDRAIYNIGVTFPDEPVTGEVLLTRARDIAAAAGAASGAAFPMRTRAI